MSQGSNTGPPPQDPAPDNMGGQPSATAVNQLPGPAFPRRRISLAELSNPYPEDHVAALIRQPDPVEEETPVRPLDAEAPHEEQQQTKVQPAGGSHGHHVGAPAVVPADTTPSDPDMRVARYISRQIADGLHSDVAMAPAEFWRTIDPSLPLLQIANKLWERSKCRDDPKPELAFEENSRDRESETKDLVAMFTDVINVAADKLGVKVYAGCAIRQLFQGIPHLQSEGYAKFGRLIAAELSAMGQLPDKSVDNPAVVISVLWKEE
ncbi:hypothetical protein F4802DRAFT_612424 [Xylaria palmicola]|nr:hypothetical protein F4802DRAFT_612424 [Xylaria palmicola]